MEPDLVELLLRESRPEPRPGFERELERRLFAVPVRRLRLRLPRPVLVGAATAVAMAVAVLGLSLAGAGPLGGSDPGVKATSNCKTVTVTKRERVPYVADTKEGRPVIGFRVETRSRQVKRCP